MKFIKKRKKELILFCVVFFLMCILLETFSFFAYKKITKVYTTEKGKFEKPFFDTLSPTTMNNALHPYLGFVMDKDSDINRFGLWDQEPVFHRSDDARIIIGIFGGSVAWGFCHFNKQRLIDKIKNIDYFKDKHIEFVNASLGGYKQPQQLIMLNYLMMLGAKFDIVINIDGFNEIYDSYTNNINRIPVFFPKCWNLYARKSIDLNEDVLSSIIKIQKIKVTGRRLENLFNDTFLDNSYFFKLLWLIIEKKVLIDLRLETIQLDKKLPSSGVTFQSSGPIEEYKTREDVYKRNADVWANCSAQMEQLCRANNIAYFHFLQPNQYVRRSKPFNDDEKRIAYNPDMKNMEVIQDSYRMFSERGRELKLNGIEFGDLTMIFSNEAETVYIDSCCHFNELGNEIMAEHIADLMTKYFINKRNQPKPVK